MIHASEIPAEVFYTAFVVFKQFHEYFLSSGFPGPGWAQKAEDLTPVYIEGYTFDGIFGRGWIPEVQIPDTESSYHNLSPFIYLLRDAVYPDDRRQPDAYGIYHTG